ncbi:hypothetical protein PBY51_000226 [Eleginops maclovinus]|uniref:Ras-associating domain-containing protein n=1 Tax=Eleginops maclovinus TaxID=56733 RepID=A0AAN7XL53_ELEMC|nr:hypothetical protein PBY51_000226 [Eleginops maclovinus]
MEVKVFVDGIPRVVCGVTDETTCQEVVIALAQALGQPGRYTLQEKFKDFERSMAPNECLLETLEKYGQQARDVRLTLLHNGPLVLDEMNRTKVGRYQPCPPLRRKDAGTRMRRGSGSLSLHRQSLPLSLRQEAEQQKEDVKRPKRKSLTLMEEAWEWLESLGKGKVYSTTFDKDSSKKTDKRNCTSLGVSLTVDHGNSGRNSRSKVRGQKIVKSDLDHQTSCCMGSQTRGKVSKRAEKTEVAKSDQVASSKPATSEDDKNSLRETIIYQLSCLQDLQDQIARIDKLILELEEKQRGKKDEQEAQQRVVEEEVEQIKFWENELKAEEGFEKDLQCQFLEMRANAVGCKAKLEEYHRKMQGLDFFAPQHVAEGDSESISEDGEKASTDNSAVSTQDQQSDQDGDVNINRKFLPCEDLNPPHALVPPGQIKERRPTGPTELREWWTRWSQAQSPQPQSKKKVIHRSELTIYLGSTKV